MSSNAERIVITGVGSISAAGADEPALWQSAVQGVAQVSERNLARLPRRLAVYAVPTLPPVRASERRLLLHADRAAQLALGAAREAWQAAGLEGHALDPLRIGLFVGTSRGPVELNTRAGEAALPLPWQSVYTTFSSIAGVIAAALQIEGCALTSSATCISGAVALKTAWQMIRMGELDLALVGGVDAPLVETMLEQFAATRVLSAEVSAQALRPFARDRGGTVMGEGAGFVVLEAAASQQRRGVRSWGVLQSVGLQCAASFRAGSDREGELLCQVTRRTLAACGVAAAEVDLVHLHGTGTRINDAMESACVRALFGGEAEQPISWASKPITGHTLGASPMFQLILTLAAMRHSFIPGTANCGEQNPACALRLSRGDGHEHRINTALSLNSGFWGNASCLCVTRD